MIVQNNLFLFVGFLIVFLKIRFAFVNLYFQKLNRYLYLVGNHFYFVNLQAFSVVFRILQLYPLSCFVRFLVHYNIQSDNHSPVQVYYIIAQVHYIVQLSKQVSYLLVLNLEL